MEFSDVVRKRRMVRHFTAEPVPHETLERIIRTAQHAPSAGFSQGIAYVLITEPETRRRMADIVGEEEGYVTAGHEPFISEASAQVLICTSEKVYMDRYREPDKKPDPDAEDAPWPIPYWHTDAGCALMLLLLAAVDAGLAAAFVATWDRKAIQNLLGIPEHFLPIGLVMIGHGAPDLPSPSLLRGRRPLDEVLHRERW